MKGNKASLLYGFIIFTLTVIIFTLMMRNPEPFAAIIKTVTDLFGASFKAVTSVGDFGSSKSTGS